MTSDIKGKHDSFSKCNIAQVHRMLSKPLQPFLAHFQQTWECITGNKNVAKCCTE